MSQAVPNVPTPLRLRKRLADVLVNDPEPSFYTDVPGLPGLRARIASSHRLAGAFGPDNVVVTAGANHAMFTSFLLHFQAGDRVVLLEPYYFNYDMGLKMLGMTAQLLLSEPGERIRAPSRPTSSPFWSGKVLEGCRCHHAQ